MGRRLVTATRRRASEYRTAFEPEGEDELRRALAESAEKIAQVEAQIADAFKSTEVAEADQGDERGG